MIFFLQIDQLEPAKVTSNIVLNFFSSLINFVQKFSIVFFKSFYQMKFILIEC